MEKAQLIPDAQHLEDKIADSDPELVDLQPLTSGACDAIECGEAINLFQRDGWA
jgi:hypothetical protein